MNQAGPILDKANASYAIRKLTETALSLEQSSDPQQRNNANGFWESINKQLRYDRRVREQQLLDNHNLGKRQNGSFSSAQNKQPYQTIGYMTTSGQLPMQDMNNAINQWDNQGLDPSVTANIKKLVHQELIRYNESVMKFIKRHKETNKNQNHVINKIIDRVREVENKNMSLDLDKNTYPPISNSTPVIPKPTLLPNTGIQYPPMSPDLHDGALNDQPPNTTHKKFEIQQAGRDIADMDKQLIKIKKENE